MFLFIFLLFGFLGTAENTVLRPNLYFGTRSTSENSHLSGIMWFEGSRLDSVRHDCKHEDDIKRWGWKEFNANGYGNQKLVDVHNYVKLDMNYVQRGNDWVLQIDGLPLKHNAQARNVSMIFYFGVNGIDGKLEVPSLSYNEKQHGTKDDVFIPFYSNDIGYGHIRIEESDNSHSPSDLNTPFSDVHFKPHKKDTSLENTFWYGRHIPKTTDGWTLIKEQLTAGYQHFASKFRQSVQDFRKKYPDRDFPDEVIRQSQLPFQPLLPNEIEKKSNFIAVQRVFTLPFSLTVYVTKDSMKSGLFSNKQVYEQSFFEEAKEHLPELFRQQSAEYHALFNSRFDLSAYSEKYQTAAKAAVSNLLGGISYFVGETEQFDEDGKRVKTEKGSLLTAVPGRSFFPRGFIWDEGFHQLVISEWNITLSEEILRSWFNRIEPSGYLEREQILGAEARSRVPDEFVPQHRKIVNPPTFILVFEKIAKLILNEMTVQVKEDGESVVTSSNEVLFLEESIPKLWKWLQYIQASQASELEHGLKWFGRSEKHCFASGFDDTPRHSIVSEKESHVDLIAWLAYAYKSLSTIELQLHGETAFYKELTALSTTLHSELLSKYWDADSHCFGDLGVVVDDDGNETIGFETHPSYISLLPFALMLIDENDPRLTDILDMIEDPEQLWSEHGLRSLSKQDPFYGTEENYWRGKVWVNINYLVLRALHTKYNHVGLAKERCQAIYAKLRSNLINTIVKEYYSSGFFWENYNSDTGKGTGVHPFTGWTTLFVLMMAERYSRVC